MTDVVSFSEKLNKELSALPWAERNELLVRIGKTGLAMRSYGRPPPIWKGPVPEQQILGADVVVPTDHGDRRGRVICFGVVSVGAETERTVIVHVPSSGTHHEAPGSLARIASPEDSMRIAEEIKMATKLVVAAEAAQRGPTTPVSDRPKKRGDRDPKLIERMLAAANASSNVRSVEEGTSNHKVTGRDPSKRIYIFKGPLRVDLSGFSFSHPNLREISDAEAREMHLGKVRGQILFDDREGAFAAFEQALLQLI